MDSYEKRGYLNQDFRLFHLTEPILQEVGYHYHDFDKIIILLKGNVDYIIEGRSYHLKPRDIILVRRHTMHRPVLCEGCEYERIIVYMSPSFIRSYKTASCDLEQCFLDAREHGSDVLQLPALRSDPLLHSIGRLEEACRDDGYAKELYCRLLFLEFMVHLNRASGDEGLNYLSTSPSSEKVLEIMRYLHDNLTEPFTIDDLASRFYLSRYHMMRLFKEKTGYTITGYISEKRLLLARELLQKSMAVTEVCYRCGFKNYSAFLRAYKKLFGETPHQMKD